MIDLVADRLGVPRPAYTPLTDDPRLHPGRAARVTAGDQLAGRVGEVHPAVVEALDLRTPSRILVGELAIAGLSGGQPSVPRTTTPTRHPAVERDLAVIVRDTVPAAEVEASIRRHAGPLLRSVALFDVYRGRPLAADEKSLAYRLAFQADDRTLVEAEIDAAVGAVTTGFGADVEGRLRG
jgi:phenylalanyl-tRNA synthetase beta chain